MGAHIVHRLAWPVKGLQRSESPTWGRRSIFFTKVPGNHSKSLINSTKNTGTGTGTGDRDRDRDRREGQERGTGERDRKGGQERGSGERNRREGERERGRKGERERGSQTEIKLKSN